jgi:hypothetical protein
MLNNAKRVQEMIFNVSYFVKSSEQSKTQTNKVTSSISFDSRDPIHEIFMDEMQFCIHPRPFLVEFSLCYPSVPSFFHEKATLWFVVTAIRSAALASHGPATKDRDKYGQFGSSLPTGRKNTCESKISPPRRTSTFIL